MPSALVVSGSGRWADPWHPFPVTSERLRQAVAAAGVDVEVREDVEDALVGLPEVDLLVLNVGDPDGPDPEDAAEQLPERPTMPVVEAVVASLHAHLDRGGALLAVHSSTTALGSFEGWSRAIGGHWVRGRTMHPPHSDATIDVHTDAHPVTTGLADIDVSDERYSWLHTEDDITVLGDHSHAGERHPMIWVREQGTARVLYDGLGHDERSYDSSGHQQLLQQGIAWLLG